MSRIYTLALYFLIIYCISSPIYGQNSSVLSSGQWAKLGVTSKGIYKIDFQTIREAGFDPASIVTDNIQLFGQGGGMLPQSNQIARPSDLQENALYRVGLEDDSFDATDYILFFSEGPNLEYINNEGHLVYQKNLYADTAYYLLTVGTQQGKSVDTIANKGDNHPVIDSYIGYAYHELDLKNILSSGREWYGELMVSSSPLRISFPNIPPLTSGSTITIISSVLNQSQERASFNFLLNDLNIGAIDASGVGPGTYDDKGVAVIDTFTVSQNEINQQAVFNFEVSYDGAGSGRFNNLQVCYESLLGQYEPATVFRSPSSLNNAFSTFTVNNVSSGTVIWDITDPQNLLIQEFTLVGDQAIFGAQTQVLREFVIFSGHDFPVPIASQPVANQDLHGMQVPDLLIVAHPLFKAEAERLAAFRAQNDQLEVQVVSPEEIYNEFSSGRQDVTAIRDFVRHLHQRSPELKYLLLFGRCSFDYKNITQDNTNYVPTYQSRNSLDPIYSHNSDDYYGFLDDDEGVWSEELSGTGGHILDIGVGRLPVTNVQEAQGIVDKLIHYASNTATLGSWRQDIYYVADDGDFNLHQRDADQLATLVDTTNHDFNVKKIYMDAFPQEQTPNGESADAVNQAIEEAIKKGALIINYTGHGSEFRWADETILDLNTINSWENFDRLPFFVTATCEFGRHDDPKRISGAEKLITNPKGGAIGLVTTSRPVFASKNFILNRAFYEIALNQTETGYPTLGDIFKYTKNDSYTIVANRNFALLGDPSMKLSYPQQNLRITEITADESMPGDTVHALSAVRMKGVVTNSEGEPILNYHGTAEVTVFDKETITETLGSEGGRTFTFKERNSVIFRGQASIKSGQFEVNFIVPKNINYQSGRGKISLYALSSNGLEDAGGATNSFIIGGSNKNAPLDNTPPQITLYMDDTSFVDGGSTGENTVLLAKITDESGINISNTGIGQDISAQLNYQEEFILNDFFKADVDTYQSGWVRYPMDKLKEGKQTITIKVWDVYNNSSNASLEFYVFDGDRLTLNQVLNYPNPFRESTTFLIDHNQPGATLEVAIRIFDIRGKLVHQIFTKYENSPSSIEDTAWNGTNGYGIELKSGIYLYQVEVKSLTSGDKNVENKKMILIK